MISTYKNGSQDAQQHNNNTNNNKNNNAGSGVSVKKCTKEEIIWSRDILHPYVYVYACILQDTDAIQQKKKTK